MRLRLLVGVTRAQGVALDALTGLGLGGALAHRLGWSPALAAGGLAVGAVIGLRWSEARAAHALEAAAPATRHALSAWLQGSGGSLRPRLEGWLQGRLAVRPLWRGWGGLLAAMVLWALAPGPGDPVAAVPFAVAPATPTLEVQVAVEPPAYSRLPTFTSAGPSVAALRGSRLTVTWRSTAAEVLVAEPGQDDHRLTLLAGQVTQALTLDRARTLRATTADGAVRQVLRLEVTPDAPPSVELLAPAEDQVLTSAPPPRSVRALASDDLGLSRTSLHFTLAQGSGESVHFKTGRVPSRSRAEGNGVLVEGRVDPVALGMAAGDTLVLWAEAADTNQVDGPQVARSGARLVRWEVPVAPMVGGSGAMPPPPASLLTQRELLARTERLVARGLRGAALQEASAELARDQRGLRISFGQVLNADSGDGLTLDVDEKEAAETTDAHARALLARAVSLMWESEAELSDTRPARSLPPQRAAVAALDQAFQLVRYSLRPFAQPDKPVDERRRLSGQAEGLRPRPRVLTSPPEPAPQLVTLALGLLGAAARGLEPAEARALGDSVWALPPGVGVPTEALASALYAAQDAGSRVAAARQAGEALAGLLRPAWLTLPAHDAEGARLVGALPLGAPGSAR